MFRRVGVFFFFKQKTAYEMRISDWSSDVCSSDLFAGKLLVGVLFAQGRREQPGCRLHQRIGRGLHLGGGGGQQAQALCFVVQRGVCVQPVQGLRSEEHTSELQSLMRISYAVFCLKKKKT